MKKNVFVIGCLGLVLSACNESNTSSDEPMTPSKISESYQKSRPVDSNRNIYAYDSNPPAMQIAKQNGVPMIGEGLLKDEAGLYTIDASFVDMNGACFQKIPNVPSRSSQWGVTKGGVSRQSATNFSKDVFANKRAEYNEAVIVALSGVKNKVDPAIIHGIISQESGYNPRAENPSSKEALASTSAKVSLCNNNLQTNHQPSQEQSCQGLFLLAKISSAFFFCCITTGPLTKNILPPVKQPSFKRP